MTTRFPKGKGTTMATTASNNGQFNNGPLNGQFNGGTSNNGPVGASGAGAAGVGQGPGAGFGFGGGAPVGVLPAQFPQFVNPGFASPFLGVVSAAWPQNGFANQGVAPWWQGQAAAWNPWTGGFPGGFNGPNGFNGFNSFNGPNGFNGFNGFSAFNPLNGFNGLNPFNGFNGFNGFSGGTGVSTPWNASNPWSSTLTRSAWNGIGPSNSVQAWASAQGWNGMPWAGAFNGTPAFNPQGYGDWANPFGGGPAMFGAWNPWGAVQAGAWNGGAVNGVNAFAATPWSAYAGACPMTGECACPPGVCFGPGTGLNSGFTASGTSPFVAGFGPGSNYGYTQPYGYTQAYGVGTPIGFSPAAGFGPMVQNWTGQGWNAPAFAWTRNGLHAFNGVNAYNGFNGYNGVYGFTGTNGNGFGVAPTGVLGLNTPNVVEVGSAFNAPTFGAGFGFNRPAFNGLVGGFGPGLGLNTGSGNGFNTPFNNGFGGFNTPYTNGFNTPYTNGFNTPYTNGFNTPYTYGFNTPYTNGFVAGGRTVGNPFVNAQWNAANTTPTSQGGPSLVGCCRAAA
jgi:hypothetical protein